MEREYQRSPARRPAAAQASEAELNERAFAELVMGLQMMSTHLESFFYNFAWAAGQITGDPDAPARIRGMMEFAVAYHQFGTDIAMDAIGDNGGVRVDIMSGHDGKGVSYRPGILVGIVGAEDSLTRDRVNFNGIAMIEDRRGRERLIAVTVSPDGSTQLHRNQYDFSAPDLISDKPVDKIFPPANRPAR